jgi:peptidoglycan hydrolase CwlO-like protein
MAIEVTDHDLYELLGRKDVEIFNDERIIGNYQTAIEKMKGMSTETETLKAAKTSLETSNGQLASKNIELDRALTEARKERDAVKGELANSVTALANKGRETEEAKQKAQTEYGELMNREADARTALEKSQDDCTALQHTCDDMQKEIDTLKAKKTKKV